MKIFSSSLFRHRKSFLPYFPIFPFRPENKTLQKKTCEKQKRNLFFPSDRLDFKKTILDIEKLGRSTSEKKEMLIDVGYACEIVAL